MGDKTNKFLLMAAAGLLVARGIPAVPAQDSDVDARLDAALQAAQADQVLTVDDADNDLGLY
ncbi:MAG: hypothetical protein GY906_39990 [bacterium]|nr:hypothetical protein [bacterium]